MYLVGIVVFLFQDNRDIRGCFLILAEGAGLWQNRRLNFLRKGIVLGLEKPFNFCQVCGGKLVRQIGPDGRLLPACTGCGMIHHLDPKVAAAGLVTLNGLVLLVQRARPPQKEFWCLPGGFVDRGEVMEDAAAREVFEETGLEVRVTGLYGLYSYPDYPVVVAIYETEIVGGSLEVNFESREARWFEPRDIPWDRLAFPSAVDALKSWADGPAR